MEAARFTRETGVDAMAVSVGNVHLMTDRVAAIDIPASLSRVMDDLVPPSIATAARRLSALIAAREVSSLIDELLRWSP